MKYSRYIITFVAIFRRFSTTFRRFSKVCPKAGPRTFPNICSHLEQRCLPSTIASILIKVRLLKLSSSNISTRAEKRFNLCIQLIVLVNNLNYLFRSRTNSKSTSRKPYSLPQWPSVSVRGPALQRFQQLLAELLYSKLFIR